jgi:small subunit ribosomal protein S20
LANHKSAIKRHRQSLKARERNRAVKSRVRNALKTVREAIDSGNKEEALATLKSAASILDKAAGKKVIHWRSAGRKVSRLTQAVNKISA